MKSLDEKIAELQKRWAELHKTPPPAKRDNYRKPVTGCKPDCSDCATKKFPPPVLTKSKDKLLSNEELKRIQDLIRDDMQKLKQMYGQNHKAPTDALKEPITWFGPLAVGEEKNFPGWWSVVLASGIKISYVGDGADKVAKDTAQRLYELGDY